MKQKKLSISIVSYNNFNKIKNAIDSIENYTNRDINKVIYIIDNSNEKEKFKLLTNKYPDVKYINAGANLGFGKGHNLVLDALESDFHAYVNPDVLLKEDSFSKILDYMEKNNIKAVAPRLVDENGDFLSVYRRDVTVFDMFIRMFCKKIFRKRIKFHELANEDFSKPFRVPFAQGSFLVFDTKLIKKLGGFDDRFFMYMEDADLCKRVNDITPLMYYPGTEIIHLWERASHKNLKLFKIHVQSMIKYMNKWGWKFF